MAIKTYSFQFGPYPQRLNIYLAEKQPANVEATIWPAPNASAGIPPAQIKALTPTGSLPILQDEDGTVIGQSLAILEYLEERASGPDMLGSTPAQRALTRQFVHQFDEALTFFALWARHGSHLSRSSVRSGQGVAEICAERYFNQIRLIDKSMGETALVAGDFVSLADCVGMATLQYASDFYGVPIPEDCARLTRWYEEFSRRSSAVSPPYPEDKRAIAMGLMQQTGIKA